MPHWASPTTLWCVWCCAAKLNSIEPQTRSELSQEGRPELGVITCVRVVLHSLTKLLAEPIRPTTALVLESLS